VTSDSARLDRLSLDIEFLPAIFPLLNDPEVIVPPSLPLFSGPVPDHRPCDLTLILSPAPDCCRCLLNLPLTSAAEMNGREIAPSTSPFSERAAPWKVLTF
jgi:hypothetical protein